MRRSVRAGERVLRHSPRRYSTRTDMYVDQRIVRRESKGMRLWNLVTLALDEGTGLVPPASLLPLRDDQRREVSARASLERGPSALAGRAPSR